MHFHWDFCYFQLKMNPCIDSKYIHMTRWCFDLLLSWGWFYNFMLFTMINLSLMNFHIVWNPRLFYIYRVFECQHNPLHLPTMLPDILVKNSVETGPRPPGHPPPSSQTLTSPRTPHVDTLSSHENNLNISDKEIFFSNSTYKKLYFKVRDSLNKYEKAASRFWFLNCFKFWYV